mmetsp:Transcript_22714/g.73567  ORF Transcript_22714/g.73567 Transcript_22714/m.73567 type:complete len:200 (-) Transcript_22714:2308-2907(-)
MDEGRGTHSASHRRRGRRSTQRQIFETPEIDAGWARTQAQQQGTHDALTHRDRVSLEPPPTSSTSAHAGPEAAQQPHKSQNTTPHTQHNSRARSQNANLSRPCAACCGGNAAACLALCACAAHAPTAWIGVFAPALTVLGAPLLRGDRNCCTGGGNRQKITWRGDLVPVAAGTVKRTCRWPSSTWTRTHATLSCPARRT